MRVIFLDIDGVMNSQESFLEDYKSRDNGKDTGKCRRCCGELFSRGAVETLQEVLNYSPDIKIVISSTWRNRERNEILDVFNDNGIDISDRWIDITPWTFKKKESEKYSEVERGYQIQEWLDDNKDKNIEEFVIIDDDQDMAHLLTKLVKTRWTEGLTKKHLPLILQQLGI